MTRRVDEARAEFTRWREYHAARDPDLFDRSTWEQPASATKRWTADALEAVRRAAHRQEHLTVSDVDWPDERLEAVDPRARGAVMVQACKVGILRATDQYVTGGAERHGRPVKVFESRVRAA